MHTFWLAVAITIGFGMMNVANVWADDKPATKSALIPMKGLVCRAIGLCLPACCRVGIRRPFPGFDRPVARRSITTPPAQNKATAGRRSRRFIP